MFSTHFKVSAVTFCNRPTRTLPCFARYTQRFFCSSDLPPPKRSPVKRANQQKKDSFWTKFDNFFERERPRKYQTTSERNKTTLLYLASVMILTVGASYAAVPLYRIFCQASGYGGTVKTGHDTSKVETMKSKKDRLLTIKFNADTAAAMQWNFRPQQAEVQLYAGETALAFYSAKNPTDKPIDGISTYNVVPFEAGEVWKIMLEFLPNPFVMLPSFYCSISTKFNVFASKSKG